MTSRWGQMRQTPTAEVRLDEGKATSFQHCKAGNPTIWLRIKAVAIEFRLRCVSIRRKITVNDPGNLGNVG
jgi:hypothetical protein